MDKLAESGVDILYSGDFDPEGLLIADKLAERYGGRFHSSNAEILYYD